MRHASIASICYAPGVEKVKALILRIDVFETDVGIGVKTA